MFRGNASTWLRRCRSGTRRRSSSSVRQPQGAKWRSRQRSTTSAVASTAPLQRVAGEGEATALQHARWFLERLRELAPALRSPRAPEVLNWYEAESANTWAALDVLLKADRESALELASELTPFWRARGHAHA